MNKKFLAIFAAKQAGFWSRIMGRGGGAALPGLIAMKIYPEIVTDLTKELEKGVLLITGTNGKTTTSKMIAEILKANGEKVLSNSGGSNLSRGIASALIEQSSLFGKIKKEIGVYEVDEATLPKITQFVSPKAIIITNIFRDQLDRYGEVDKTAAILKRAIKSAPDAALILNADDPIVSSLGKDQGNTIYFGISDEKLEAKSDLAIDIKDCLICGTELVYLHRYYGHIGEYLCENCGFTKPKTSVTAKNVRLSPDRTSADIKIGRENAALTLPMIGLYNLYNALAAVTAGNFLKIKNTTIFKTLNNQKPAFGRMESFLVNDKKAVIHLVKNPIGFNQVLEAITQDRKSKVALVALNDNFADGTDISWIWDSEFELFKNGFRKIIVSGIRSEDLRLRLKYADVTSKIIISEKDPSIAFDHALNLTNTSETLYILPTYTAMLELRNNLVKKGIVKDYWKKR